MKTNLPLWVLMLSNTFLLAQPNLIQEDHYKLDSTTQEEINNRMINYAYDQQGRVIQKVDKFWVDNEGWKVSTIDEFYFYEQGGPTLVDYFEPLDTMEVFFGSSSLRNLTEYDEEHRKIRESRMSFNPNLDDWVDTRITSWKYSENNCLAEMERLSFSTITATQEIRKEEFYYSNSCQADSSIVWVISTRNPEWKWSQRNLFSYNEVENTSTTEIYFWDIATENWVLERIIFEKTDEKDKWLEYEILFANTGRVDRFVRTFNERDQQVYHAILQRLPGQTEFQQISEIITTFDEAGNVLSIQRSYEGELAEEVTYKYDYDLNGFLTQLHYHSITFFDQLNVIEEYTHNYDNYCDGLARKSTLNWSYASSNTPEKTNIYYVYDEGIDCEEAPTDEPIIVYPNPTPDGIVYIQSEFLLYAPIQYLVFDNLGRQLLSGELTERVTAQTLDLSALQNGMYYLHLLHDSKNTIRKLIIQKN